MQAKKLALAAGGAVAGFINGFLGGGGGVVMVTLLLSVAGLGQKKAQATALLAVLPLTVVSAVVYLLCGRADWPPTLYATLGVTAGGAAGALLLGKMNGNTAKILFAVVLLAGGVRMFF